MALETASLLSAFHSNSSKMSGPCTVNEVAGSMRGQTFPDARAPREKAAWPPPAPSHTAPLPCARRPGRSRRCGHACESQATLQPLQGAPAENAAQRRSLAMAAKVSRRAEGLTSAEESSPGLCSHPVPLRPRAPAPHIPDTGAGSPAAPRLMTREAEAEAQSACGQHPGRRGACGRFSGQPEPSSGLRRHPPTKVMKTV